jgi:hypothetical protein
MIPRVPYVPRTEERHCVPSGSTRCEKVDLTLTMSIDPRHFGDKFPTVYNRKGPENTSCPVDSRVPLVGGSLGTVGTEVGR